MGTIARRNVTSNTAYFKLIKSASKYLRKNEVFLRKLVKSSYFTLSSFLSEERPRIWISKHDNKHEELTRSEDRIKSDLPWLF